MALALPQHPRPTKVPPNHAIARFGGTSVVQAALDPNASAAVRGQIRSSVRWFGVPKRCAVIDTACSRTNGRISSRPASVTGPP